MIQSLLFALKEVSDSDLMCSSERFRYNMRYRFSSTQRLWTGISLLGLQPELASRYAFPHGRHNSPQIRCPVQERALGHAAFRVLAERIAMEKPLILVHCAGSGNSDEHGKSHAVPVKGMYGALNQAFTCHIAVPDG
jgi:hypothetical protein